MSSVIIALVVGVFTGAFVVWLATGGQGHGNPAVMQSQGEIKARLDEALAQVQHLGAIFANARQRGRAGELVLEHLSTAWIGTETSNSRSAWTGAVPMSW